jgi:hypothetical protein
VDTVQADSDGRAFVSRFGTLAARCRALALLWCAILVGLIGSGAFSSARIGQMAWGPQYDIWSAAIAISQINLGLSGELGYREVELAIAGEVTAKKNAWQVFDDATRAMLKDPSAVTRGFQAGAALQKSQIAIPDTKAGYTINWALDYGYADFYNIAFRLFGFNAFATHWLYVSILALSVLLFGAAHFRSNLAVGSLVLCVTALFLESSSATFFGELLPNIANNRFLSTLGLVPVLHVICTALARRPLGPAELGIVGMQAVILQFVVSNRSSAQWCYLAAAFAMLAVAVRRFCLVDRDVASSEPSGGRPLWLRVRRVPNVLRILAVGLLLFAVVGAAGTIRKAQMDESYFGEGNLPYHFFWHNAFLALTLHPEWERLKPSPDIPAGSGDAVGFAFFEKEMTKAGKPFIFNTTFYMARDYEVFIRGQLIRFLISHPRYALELYLWYKPKVLIESISPAIRSIPTKSWLLAVVSVMVAIVLFGLVLAIGSLLEFTIVVLSMWLFSLLPVFWAYGISFTIADQIWSALFVGLALVSQIGSMVARFGLRTASHSRATTPYQQGSSGAQRA